MHISVVVVSWNGLHVLRSCVAALAEQTLPHELIVVDNGSRDGTREWLAQHAPEARVLGLPENLGFAGGNNVGLRVARGDHLVLLNNDTLPAPNFLEQLVAPLAAAEDIGSTAGVLTFAHRPDLVASAGIVAGRDGVHRDLAVFAPVASLPRQPVEIFGPSGGAVCFRRAALDDVGLFDERYFNYLEDADLAWRLRLRGWHCLQAPDAHARHIYSATAGQGSPFKQRLLARNRWRLIIRCVPSTLLRRFWPLMLRYDLLALSYALLKRQPAIVAGRAAIMRELPDLIGARRRMHKRARVSGAELEQWLASPVSVRTMLAEQRLLARVLSRI